MEPNEDSKVDEQDAKQVEGNEALEGEETADSPDSSEETSSGEKPAQEEPRYTKPFPPAPEGTEYFLLRNTVMSPHTRSKRVASPGPNKEVQFLGGGAIRVVPGRDFRVTKYQVQTYKTEILQKIQRGELQLLGPNGQPADIEALKYGPPPPPVPLPKDTADSMNNDTPTGVAMPKYPGGDPVLVDDPNRLPDLVTKAPKEVVQPLPGQEQDEFALMAGGVMPEQQAPAVNTDAPIQGFPEKGVPAETRTTRKGRHR